jgi:hypothetical protein
MMMVIAFTALLLYSRDYLLLTIMPLATGQNVSVRKYIFRANFSMRLAVHPHSCLAMGMDWLVEQIKFFLWGIAILTLLSSISYNRRKKRLLRRLKKRERRQLPNCEKLGE